MPVRRTRTTRRTPTSRRVARRSTRKVSRPWSREEIAFMRKYYRKYETAWIARQLGRTVYSVRYKAVDLSIRKASPSVWRGNKGAANAFRKPANWNKWQKNPRPTRRPSRQRSYRATTNRRTARKSNPRRNRRR